MKIIFIIVFLLALNKSFCQFKKLEFSYFVIDSNFMNFKINSYVLIDSIGNLSIKNESDYIDIVIKNFSAKLTKNELIKFNNLFIDTVKLGKSFITKKLTKNTFYGKNFEFIKVEYKTGKVDSVCTISPFMNKKYNEIIKILDKIIFRSPKKNKIKSIEIDKGFKSSLLNTYKKSTYLHKNIKIPFTYKS